MDKLSKHVLIITSTNLACNPRCLKEVRLLSTMDVRISVIAFNLHNWTNDKEIEINKEINTISFKYLECTNKQLLQWFISSVFEKICRLIRPFFSANVFVAAIATSKRSWLLLRYLRKQKVRPDFIIAHNPPAFYPAYYAAKKYKIPFAIDVEDYHPGEYNKKNLQDCLKLLMQKVIPETLYSSYASPLIKKYTGELITKSDNMVIVNNFFSKNDFNFYNTIAPDKLQLAWFSQNIDKGRGLEEFFPVYDEFESLVDLTLIGNTVETFYNKHLQHRKEIKIIQPLNNVELNKTILKFDIGLALDPPTNLNNRVKLSNKILTYFQAGLYILASDTEAQRFFIEQHSQHGVISSLSHSSLKAVLKNIVESKEKIRQTKKDRFESASFYNWENESKGLMNQWQQVLY